MQNWKTRCVDITTALTAGDVEFKTLRDTNNAYNMIPIGIMVTMVTADADAAGASEAVVCCLVGSSEREVTLNLLPNKPYDFAIDKVIKTGTTTEKILIFGMVN